MNTPRSIIGKLEERKQKNAFRELFDLSGYIDFFSNDYLGLSKWTSEMSGSHGSTGSRLISGNSIRSEEIENELASFFNSKAGLLFNSGYDANLGLLSSVPQKSDTVIYDQLIHASIRDGVRLCNASSFSFKHNDLEDLKAKLLRANGERYVVVESIYSMDGDAAPLKELVKVCEENNAYLIVDEAHAGGIFGPNGKGLVTANGLDDAVFAKLITFGKAYGSHGAIVLGSNDLRDYLINFARSLIYTTALPLNVQEKNLRAVHKAAELNQQNELQELINLFKSKVMKGHFEAIESDSPIQCMIIPGNQEAKALADKIINEQIAVKAILSPTVPEGKERLRFCVHSYNTHAEIEKLAQIIHG